MALRKVKRSYSVSKIQSLPRLALLSFNSKCDSVARDAFILVVFIVLVAETPDVAGNTLTGVV